MSTCTLIGCFCAPTTFVPVLCALLDEQDASQDVLLARLKTLAALLQGSGKAQPAPISYGCNASELSDHL